MNLLIIGARGMLGQALADAFANMQPTLWDHEELNITDESLVREKISTLHPTTIINAAAYTAVDKAETEKDIAFAINETGVRNLAKVAKDIQATLVHYSTDYVFPGTKADGYSEDDPPGPAVNVYGESKLSGERALAEIAPQYFLIRTAWLYGPGGKNFVDTMLTLAETRPEIAVINDQQGSPTYTHHLAQATKTLLSGSYPPGTYHLVNTGQATWYEFSRAIFTRAGKEITVKPISHDQYPLPAQRPQYSMLKNTRGPALPTWETALDEYLSLHANSTLKNHSAP